MSPFVVFPLSRWALALSKLPKRPHLSCSPLCSGGLLRLQSYQSVAIYRVPSSAQAKIGNSLGTSPTNRVDGCRGGNRYCLGGRDLRGGATPPRTPLYGLQPPYWLEIPLVENEDISKITEGLENTQMLEMQKEVTTYVASFLCLFFD